MEQAVDKVVRIMTSSYGNGRDELLAMAKTTRELAEALVSIFGINAINEMSPLEILKLGKAIDKGYSMGFKAGFAHAKTMEPEEPQIGM